MANEHRTQAEIVELRCEHRQEAFGIGTARPRLSWRYETNQQNWRQAAYEIEARGEDGESIGRTGKVETDQQVWVAWPFAPLASRQRVEVRVRGWGSDGQVTDWSPLLPIEVSLLHAEDWQARFVSPDWEEDISRAQQAPLLRYEFTTRAAVKRARLYVTALGVYEVQINGQVVGDHVMAPGWTSYRHRLRYQTFDVTGLVQRGPNAVAAMLGDGWFRGGLGFNGGRRNVFGDRLALLAQLEIEYEDGSRETVGTDAGWRAAKGPILETDIYNGETHDARLEPRGWAQPGFDDSGWKSARAVEWDLETLFAPLGPPVRRIEFLSPVAITASPSGKIIVDFGQNVTGRLRLAVEGPVGTTITLRHAEVLENGELCTRPLRFAKATDRYILRGEGVEQWEPRFTFHGFRYAEVDGWPGELRPENIQAVVCHSDMERTGWFECSEPLVNQFHQNVVWSMRGNFLDIPTDCPQRDERLGWTGDLQVFSPAASFLYDVTGFLRSWLADLAAEQMEAGGIVPMFVPNVMGDQSTPTAGWGDAAAIVPWVLYQRFGDGSILEKQFESMRAWVDVVARTTGEALLWEKGVQFGDWLDPNAPPDKPGDARTASFIVATAYLAHSARLVGKVAGVLGRAEEEKHYLDLAERVRAAFGREYITPAGRMVCDTQTAYALGLQFGLLPEGEQREHAARRLAALVRAGGFRINSGFVGTALILDALCSIGEVEAAYHLMLQRECPSWLYPVTMGATTIWERWDSMLPDGTVNPGEMTSFNHYALGAVADWLHRAVAGLAPAAPGYKQLEIRPLPGGGLRYAWARHKTPYGMAASSWRYEDGKITVEVEVPPNSSARVTLPGRAEQVEEVGSGSYRWTYPYAGTGFHLEKLTLESTLGALSEQPQAYKTVLKIIAGFNEEFADRARGQQDLTIRQVVSMVPHSQELEELIAAALEGMAPEQSS